LNTIQYNAQFVGRRYTNRPGATYNQEHSGVVRLSYSYAPTISVKMHLLTL